MTSVENEIAIVPSSETALVVFTAENGLDPFLKKIREEIDLFCLSNCELDLSKESNRKKIASMAHKVARSKTALDDAGMALSAQLKDMPRKVDAERRRMREILDKWKEEVREPLTAWEEAEEERIFKINEKIQHFRVMQEWAANPYYHLLNKDYEYVSRINQIKDNLSLVKGEIIDESYGEYIQEAEAQKNKAIVLLQDLLERRVAFEAEEAEKQRIEEEARIEAEKKAEAERVEREKQAEIERLEREKRIAEEAKREAEEEAARKARLEKEAAERRELELRLAAEKAQREALEAEERARKAAIEAEERVRREAEEAARKQEEERLKREADEKHKNQVHAEIIDDIVGLGLSRDWAIEVCDALARGGEIRHVEIGY